MLDLSKNVFLSPSCTGNTTISDNVLRVLANYKVPKDKIKHKIDIDMVNSEDYMIRYLDGKVQAWKIELTLPFGYTTKFIGEL